MSLSKRNLLLQRPTAGHKHTYVWKHSAGAENKINMPCVCKQLEKQPTHTPRMGRRWSLVDVATRAIKIFIFMIIACENPQQLCGFTRSKRADPGRRVHACRLVGPGGKTQGQHNRTPTMTTPVELLMRVCVCVSLSKCLTLAVKLNLIFNYSGWQSFGSPWQKLHPRRYGGAIKNRFSKTSSWQIVAWLSAIRAVVTLRPLPLQLPQFAASKIHHLHQPACCSSCSLFAFSRCSRFLAFYLASFRWLPARAIS